MIQQEDNAYINHDDFIHLDQEYESNKFLEGKKVQKAIQTAILFLQESIDSLRIPKME